MTKKTQIKNLKVGCGVNHPVHGYMQYRGLATINPYSHKVAVPYKYIFWLPIDENGNISDDFISTNGDEYVDVVED